MRRFSKLIICGVTAVCLPGWAVAQSAPGLDALSSTVPRGALELLNASEPAKVTLNAGGTRASELEIMMSSTVPLETLTSLAPSTAGDAPTTLGVRSRQPTARDGGILSVTPEVSEAMSTGTFGSGASEVASILSTPAAGGSPGGGASALLGVETSSRIDTVLSAGKSAGDGLVLGR